jgi:ribosomal protein S27AE
MTHTNTFEFVERVADEEAVHVTTQHIQHILGTLRFAGFPQRLAESELATARRMIKRELRSIVARSPYVREASTKEAPKIKVARFNEIQQMVAQNQCPRCQTGMTEVQLANYEGAKYCGSCRVTLW